MKHDMRNFRPDVAKILADTTPEKVAERRRRALAQLREEGLIHESAPPPPPDDAEPHEVPQKPATNRRRVTPLWMGIGAVLAVTLPAALVAVLMSHGAKQPPAASPSLHASPGAGLSATPSAVAPPASAGATATPSAPAPSAAPTATMTASPAVTVVPTATALPARPRGKLNATDPLRDVPAPTTAPTVEPAPSAPAPEPASSSNRWF